MTTRRTLLDRAQIATPCTANWNEMQGTDQIRFCSECNKYVYNLSEMTQCEAEELLVTSRDQMCVRLIRDLNGQTLTVESLPPVRLLGWRPGPVASAVVSAMISLAPAASPLANGQVSSQSSHTLDRSGHNSPRALAAGATAAIAGIVTNENGAAISGALVTLTGEATGEVLSQLTAEDGEFRFDELAACTYIVEIQAKDYSLVKHHDVVLRQGEARRLDVGLEKLMVFMGSTGRIVQPLRTLYLESDRVVVAEVGKSTEARRGRASQIKTSLSVSQTIKGDGHKPVIDVFQSGNGREESPLTEGETVLVFLQRKEDARGANTYDLIDDGTSAKHLSPSDLATYLSRIEELKDMIARPDHESNDMVEWLVRCAENPATRRDGAFELYISTLNEQYEKSTADRATGAGQPLSSTGDIQRARTTHSASLLTGEQKERLVNALLRSDELSVNGDFELIELVRRWNDPRLLPFLLSNLRRFEETAPDSLWRVMETVAEILDDGKLGALLRHYREDEPVTDLESELDKIAKADSDEGEDKDEDPNEDESTDEVAAAPELTPEAARQVRVDVLKKFLEAADARMKRAATK